MAQLSSIVSYLDSLLLPAQFDDYGFNGLQVEGPRSDVRKIAFAVDSGMSVIEEAVAQDANLLVVHHGLLWGKTEPITGAFGKKIEYMLRSRLSLYASHLPLDSHAEVGNAFELGRFLDLSPLEPYFEHKGKTIGAKAKLKKARELEYFVEKLQSISGTAAPLVLPFGQNSVESVAILTGSGASGLDACARDGIDLLISGEAKHEAYHKAKEHNLNAIFAGHYATETFGVKALQNRLQRDFDVETCFIDEPTGI